MPLEEAMRTQRRSVGSRVTRLTHWLDIPCDEFFELAMKTTFLRSRRGDLNWPLFWHLLPPVVLGTAIGAFAGGLLPGPVLRVILHRIRRIHDRARDAPPLWKVEVRGRE